MTHSTLHCWIYKGHRHDGAYLYLGRESDFAAVPEALLHTLGTLRLVMELELSAERRLAREDVGLVMHNLRAQGYHLQLPPDWRPRFYAAEDGQSRHGTDPD
ncbi:MAG: YcgL domain-containing protein [Gammaproteobacteria bacterium]|nr:YcgL domain-containing protein [Gammaproteobacteria bacterium]